MPLGIRMLERNTPRTIAWAWGINGSLSVLGSIVAMMVSVTMGITATMLFGAAAYLLSASAAGSAGKAAEPRRVLSMPSRAARDSGSSASARSRGRSRRPTAALVAVASSVRV